MQAKMPATKRTLVIGTIFLCVAVACVVAAVHWMARFQPFPNGYYLLDSPGYGTMLCNKIGRVEVNETITRHAVVGRFIIGKRLLADSGVECYFVLDSSSGVVHDNLTDRQYADLLDRFGVRSPDW